MYSKICFIIIYTFLLGAFAKLQKATISFVLSVCASVHLSVRLPVSMEQLGSQWTDFETWYLSCYRTSVKRIQVSLKSYKNNGYFT